MHCTQCGAALSDGARFCASCGSPTNALSGASPPAHSAPPQPNNIQYGWIIGAVVGIVVIVLILGAGARSFGTYTTPSSDYSSQMASVNQQMHEAMNGGLSENCTPGKFKIKEMHGTTEYGMLTVVGVVHNGCDEAAGVQLKLSQYDSKGSLVATDDQWPASVSNIGAHQDYEFKLMAQVPDSAVKYGVAPTDVRRW